MQTSEIVGVSIEIPKKLKMSDVGLEGIKFISGDMVKQLVCAEDVLKVAKRVFVSISTGDVNNFSVVSAQQGRANAVFDFKPGFNKTCTTLGVSGYCNIRFEIVSKSELDFLRHAC